MALVKGKRTSRVHSISMKIDKIRESPTHKASSRHGVARRFQHFSSHVNLRWLPYGEAAIIANVRDGQSPIISDYQFFMGNAQNKANAHGGFTPAAGAPFKCDYFREGYRTQSRYRRGGLRGQALSILPLNNPVLLLFSRAFPTFL